MKMETQNAGVYIPRQDKPLNEVFRGALKTCNSIYNSFHDEINEWELKIKTHPIKNISNEYEFKKSVEARHTHNEDKYKKYQEVFEKANKQENKECMKIVKEMGMSEWNVFTYVSFIKNYIEFLKRYYDALNRDPSLTEVKNFKPENVVAIGGGKQSMHAKRHICFKNAQRKYVVRLDDKNKKYIQKDGQQVLLSTLKGRFTYV
jgi:hypothetical protein